VTGGELQVGSVLDFGSGRLAIVHKVERNKTRTRVTIGPVPGAPVPSFRYTSFRNDEPVNLA